MYVCMYVYTYVHTHTYIYVYIHIHICHCLQQIITISIYLCQKNHSRLGSHFKVVFVLEIEEGNTGCKFGRNRQPCIVSGLPNCPSIWSWGERADSLLEHEEIRVTVRTGRTRTESVHRDVLKVLRRNVHL